MSARRRMARSLDQITSQENPSINQDEKTDRWRAHLHLSHHQGSEVSKQMMFTAVAWPSQPTFWEGEAPAAPSSCPAQAPAEPRLFTNPTASQTPSPGTAIRQDAAPGPGEQDSNAYCSAVS